MAYKDLQYSLRKFESNVRSHIARKNPLQSADTLPLVMWIAEERLMLKMMRLSAEHRLRTAQAFEKWIGQQSELEDIGSGLSQLLYKEAEIEAEALGKHEHATQIIRTIYERDVAEMADIREKHAAVKSRFEYHLRHHRQETGNYHSTFEARRFESQLSDLSIREQEQQREMGDYTRLALREAFYMKLNALHAYGQKASMLARTGSVLVQLENQKDGREQDLLLMDCMLAIDGWEIDERPTVMDMLLDLDGQADVDAELLSDNDIDAGAAAAAAAASAATATATAGAWKSGRSERQ